MLSLLHIENIAVIESADISFDGGFTVLTGETGAGKSIVIDAISAILGERAYRDMIRTGANKATVRAVFTGVPKLQWFEDNGVEYDPETIVQREIFLDGKNVCRVNGSLVTVSILRKLGIQLINIHGQHDSASLFDEDNHLAFLDAFAGNEALRSDYGEKYETVAKLRREIDRLTMDEGEKLRRMETLKYQIAEIEKAELEPGEDERLEDRRKILQNAEKLSNGMETAVECLYGGDDTDGAAGLLAQAEYALARLSRFSDSFNALHERVADLMYQVQDAAEEVRDARDGLSYSADELEQIESRLDVIHKLRRKYGTTCEDILSGQREKRAGRHRVCRRPSGTAERETPEGGKSRMGRGDRPPGKPESGGKGHVGAHPDGADPAGYAESAVFLRVPGDGADCSRRGLRGVLHVRQRGRSPEAHEQGGLRR